MFSDDRPVKDDILRFKGGNHVGEASPVDRCECGEEAFKILLLMDEVEDLRC